MDSFNARVISADDEKPFVEQHLEDLWIGDDSEALLKKYVGIHYPATVCNLKCPYCYVGKLDGFRTLEKLEHEPEFIRWCLSQKRLGGRALIGICGSGETLLGDRIIEVSLELLKEGHFIHIVTNGTLGDRMGELIKRANKHAYQILFKCSLHYNELKKQHKLDDYAANIKKIVDSDASYTIELTADDSYIPVIDEIKLYCLHKFGALPQVTIARDDTKTDIPIMTNLALEEYYDTWKSFNSKLFEVKWNYYKKKIKNCDAGNSSLYIDLLSGNIMKCLHMPVVGNIYDTHMDTICCERVGNECELPYCYNNHAYLTLGVCEDIKTYSYADVRDRTTKDGCHWIKTDFRKFIGQKLYENR